VVPAVNASYLHERLRPRFVTGLPGGSSMSAPFGELATDADVTRILHGRPAALDPFRTFASARSGQKARRCRKPDRKYRGQQGPLDWPAPLRALRLPNPSPTGHLADVYFTSGKHLNWPPFDFRGTEGKSPQR
jgi:hypothetical protein